MRCTSGMGSRKLMNSRMSRVEDSPGLVIRINLRLNLKAHSHLPHFPPRVRLAWDLPLRCANGGPMMNPLWLLSLVTAPAASPSIGPVSVEYRPRAAVWRNGAEPPYASGQVVRGHSRARRDG